MDIMRPPLDQQVSPAPWLLARSTVDVPALIKKTLVTHPDASNDQIARQLANGGVQVSGIVIAMWRQKWKAETGQSRPDEVRVIGAISATDADIICTCDEMTCTCGERVSPLWHQYCCGVRLTPEQAKARDEFLSK